LPDYLLWKLLADCWAVNFQSSELLWWWVTPRELVVIILQYIIKPLDI
jgi:hypothetical protein